MAVFDFPQLRRNMVDCQIRTTDVTDLRLLEAILAVPREKFVADSRQASAYADQDIDIGSGRHLMNPSPLARLIQLAGVTAQDRVLEVGSGSGYGTAILSKLAATVVALESDAALADAAAHTLAELGCGNVATIKGPLAAGVTSKGQYDVIIVAGAVDEVPAALFVQLAEGGRLVAVEGEGNAGIAKLHVKRDGHVSSRRAFNASVKPLPGMQKEPGFVF
jgi:protein-L-isoaspartate(D-aspartate) O-methyltransferase